MEIYGTLGCHLCDEARAIVVPIFKLNDIAYKEVDIGGSEVLVERYGTRIPVIKSDVTGGELDWPFSMEEFVDWLQQN